jgi:hypothetical protein
MRDALLEAVAGHLCQVHSELTREAAYRWTRVRAREARLIDRREIAAVRGRDAKE